MKNILIYIVGAVIVVAIAGSLVYLHVNNAAEQQTINNFAQSANPAAATLQAMIDTHAAQGALNTVIAAQYTPVEQAFHDTDSLFTISTSATNSTTNASPKLAEANVLRQKVADSLAAWKKTIDEVQGSMVPNIALINEANSELATLQSYLSQLQSILSSLTTDSGLTQQQIAQIQASIDAANAAMNATQTTITNAEDNAGVVVTNNQATVTMITDTDIQNQQNVVDQTQGDQQTPPSGQSGQPVDSSSPPPQNTDTDTTVSPSSPSSPAPDASGSPQLIEGENSL